MLNPHSIPVSLDVLEVLMNKAWPASDSETRQGWTLRSAGSVTQRANSIWPAGRQDNVAAALRDATDWYAARRQPVIFQLTHRPENAALGELLDQHRYSRQSETIIMTAGCEPGRETPTPDGAAVASSDAAASDTAAFDIVFDDTPSEQWLDLWWRVDGRGGAAERHIARSILQGAPSIYATAVNSHGAAIGTGRMTLVDGWGGVYGMAVHPEFRRQGVAKAILAGLLAAGQEAGTSSFWLMVTAANTGAQKLYEDAGFAEVGRYHYRQAPLHRSPSAC
jgi:ribosomal protein S18 acetylase RimI-like enzyme